MGTNKVNQGMVRIIVKRAIQRIQEDPDREIRNLVDLGNMFARGKFQKQFFQAAVSELEKDKSLYYTVARKLIQNTDRDALLDFGMNFGFNSLTYGAKQIRAFEASSGFNVPWVIIIKLNAQGALSATTINQLVQQGKAMGVYSYIFMIEPGFGATESLTSVMRQHDDCAFLLEMPSSILTGTLTPVSLLSLTNIVIGLDIDQGSPEETAAATIMLRDRRVFCAACCRLDDGQWTDLEHIAARAITFGFELLFLLPEGTASLGKRSKIDSAITAYRNQPPLPIIPFDLLSDIVMIDRNVSSEGCAASIASDGTLSVVNMDTGETKTACNILTMSLEKALRSALPKQP